MRVGIWADIIGASAGSEAGSRDQDLEARIWETRKEHLVHGKHLT